MMLFSHKGTIFTHNTKGLPRLDTGIFGGGGVHEGFTLH